MGDDILFTIPPAGRSVGVRTADHALSVAFTLHTTRDALVLAVDRHCNLVVAAECRPTLTDVTAAVGAFGRLGEVRGVVVVTSPIDTADLSDALVDVRPRVGWAALADAVAAAGSELVDWVHVDDADHRSLRPAHPGRAERPRSA